MFGFGYLLSVVEDAELYGEGVKKFNYKLMHTDDIPMRPKRVSMSP